MSRLEEDSHTLILSSKGETVEKSDPISLVTVRSNSESEIASLKDYLATKSCSVGATTRENPPVDLNLDPALVQEMMFKVLVPIATSILPKLVEWAITRPKPKAEPSTLIIELKGKKIEISGSASPEAIKAAVNAAIGK